MGLCSLQRSSSSAARIRRCRRPDGAASTFADGRGRWPWLANCHGPIPAFLSRPRPFVLAVFRLALRARVFDAGDSVLESSRDRVHHPSLEASDRRDLETFAAGDGSVIPGVPVSLVRSFAAWPAWRALYDGPPTGTAHGILPFAALLRPDSSARVIRGGGPRVVCTGPNAPINFRRVTGRRTEPDSHPNTRLFYAADRVLRRGPPSGLCPVRTSHLCRRSIGGRLCCRGLCLFRVCRTLHRCSVAGSSPHAFVGRRLFLFEAALRS